jgi:hypothetical protein
LLRDDLLASEGWKPGAAWAPVAGRDPAEGCPAGMT